MFHPVYRWTTERPIWPVVAARYHFVTTTVELEFISHECPYEIEGLAVGFNNTHRKTLILQNFNP